MFAVQELPARTVEDLAASIDVPEDVVLRLLHEWEAVHVVERVNGSGWRLTPAALAAFAAPLADSRPDTPAELSDEDRDKLYGADGELPELGPEEEALASRVCVSCSKPMRTRGRVCSGCRTREWRRRKRGGGTPRQGDDGTPVPSASRESDPAEGGPSTDFGTPTTRSSAAPAPPQQWGALPLGEVQP